MHPAYKGVFPTPVMGEPPHWLHTMCLNIGFVTYVHSVEIAESIEGRMRWVVTCPDRIEIVLPDEDEKDREMTTNKR